ncbi:MAG: hypothetical protein ACFFCW_24105 [Candidatus Hodarchaeota archaeon]
MKNLITTCLVVLFSASIVNAEVTEYYDRTDWETAAVAAYLIETFDDATLNPEISSNKSAVSGGVWSDQVSVVGPSETWFSFNPDIYAFGGDWDLFNPGGPGSGIVVSLDGEPEGYIDGYYTGFWGIVSTEPFSTVLLQAASTGPGVETFELDDMVYTTQKPAIIVAIDIKPESCPNPIKLKSKGVLAVAILSTEDFDVTQIDPASVKLSREGVGVGVAPLRWAYEDVATPFEGELCDCHMLGPDGYLDLTLKFDVPELVEDLELNDVAGETIPLILTGNLKEEFGGTLIDGGDCVWVLE